MFRKKLAEFQRELRGTKWNIKTFLGFGRGKNVAYYTLDPETNQPIPERTIHTRVPTAIRSMLREIKKTDKKTKLQGTIIQESEKKKEEKAFATIGRIATIAARELKKDQQTGIFKKRISNVERDFYENTIAFLDIDPVESLRKITSHIVGLETNSYIKKILNVISDYNSAIHKTSNENDIIKIASAHLNKILLIAANAESFYTSFLENKSYRQFFKNFSQCLVVKNTSQPANLHSQVHDQLIFPDDNNHVQEPVVLLEKKSPVIEMNRYHPQNLKHKITAKELKKLNISTFEVGENNINQIKRDFVSSIHLCQNQQNLGLSKKDRLQNTEDIIIQIQNRLNDMFGKDYANEIIKAYSQRPSYFLPFLLDEAINKKGNQRLAIRSSDELEMNLFKNNLNNEIYIRISANEFPITDLNNNTLGYLPGPVEILYKLKTINKNDLKPQTGFNLEYVSSNNPDIIAAIKGKKFDQSYLKNKYCNKKTISNALSHSIDAVEKKLADNQFDSSISTRIRNILNRTKNIINIFKTENISNEKLITTKQHLDELRSSKENTRNKLLSIQLPHFLKKFAMEERNENRPIDKDEQRQKDNHINIIINSTEDDIKINRLLSRMILAKGQNAEIILKDEVELWMKSSNKAKNDPDLFEKGANDFLRTIDESLIDKSHDTLLTANPLHNFFYFHSLTFRSWLNSLPEQIKYYILSLSDPTATFFEFDRDDVKRNKANRFEVSFKENAHIQDTLRHLNNYASAFSPEQNEETFIQNFERTIYFNLAQDIIVRFDRNMKEVEPKIFNKTKKIDELENKLFNQAKDMADEEVIELEKEIIQLKKEVIQLEYLIKFKPLETLIDDLKKYEENDKQVMLNNMIDHIQKVFISECTAAIEKPAEQSSFLYLDELRNALQYIYEMIPHGSLVNNENSLPVHIKRKKIFEKYSILLTDSKRAMDIINDLLSIPKNILSEKEIQQNNNLIYAIQETIVVHFTNKSNKEDKQKQGLIPKIIDIIQQQFVDINKNKRGDFSKYSKELMTLLQKLYASIDDGYYLELISLEKYLQLDKEALGKKSFLIQDTDGSYLLSVADEEGNRNSNKLSQDSLKIKQRSEIENKILTEFFIKINYRNSNFSTLKKVNYNPPDYPLNYENRIFIETAKSHLDRDLKHEKKRKRASQEINQNIDLLNQNQVSEITTKTEVPIKSAPPSLSSSQSNKSKLLFFNNNDQSIACQFLLKNLDYFVLPLIRPLSFSLWIEEESNKHGITARSLSQELSSALPGDEIEGYRTILKSLPNLTESQRIKKVQQSLENNPALLGVLYKHHNNKETLACINAWRKYQQTKILEDNIAPSPSFTRSSKE